MTTQTEALKLALEALEVAEHFLEEYAASKYYFAHVAAITAVKEALAGAECDRQPEQEPCDMGVACIGCSPRNSNGSCPHEKPNGACDCYVIGFNDGMKELEPPQRTAAEGEDTRRAWVGLTYEDWTYLRTNCGSIRSAVETAEAKLKEKNT